MADPAMNNEQDAQNPEQPMNAAPVGADDSSAEIADANAQEPRDDTSVDSVEHAATEALDDADQAAAAISEQAAQMDVSAAMDLPEFSGNGVDETNDQLAQSMGLLSDVSLDVTIELGRTRMYVEDVLRLNANSIVELDKAAGDPVDIYVNDRHVARGEVLVLNENFCVRVSEIITDSVAPETE